MKRIRGKVDRNCWIAIDNGTTGTIGVIGYDFTDFYKTPIKSELNYQKKKQNIMRVDHDALYKLLQVYCYLNVKLIMERPFTGKFNKANTSAGRACESTLIAIERLNIPLGTVKVRLSRAKGLLTQILQEHKDKF